MALRIAGLSSASIEALFGDREESLGSLRGVARDSNMLPLCTLCYAGTYIDPAGSCSCISCPAGTYSEVG